MEDALKEVDTYADNVKILGGTEIYKPLQDIFNRKSGSGLKR